MGELTKIEHRVDKLAAMKEAYKRTYCKGADDDELEVFAATCLRTGLSPESRQIFAVKRWDSDLKREVLTPQISIDGYRLIAQRSGKYAGQEGPYWCGDDGVWKDVWLSSQMPVAAKVGVLRTDWRIPIFGIARWDAYVQKKKEGGITSMWEKMGDHMLAKCAEGLALRKAFPQELAGTPLGNGGHHHDAITIEASTTPSKDQVDKMLAAFGAMDVARMELEQELQVADIYCMSDADYRRAQELYRELKASKAPKAIEP